MFDWHGLIKRYVWDDDTTPYFVPVPKLSREQAENELFLFSFLFAIFFAVISVLAFAGKLPMGPSRFGTGYAFSIVGAAVLVSTMKSRWAAVYCAGGPAAMIAVVFFFGFPEKMALPDELLFLALTLCVLRYSLRVVRIAIAFPDLPSRPPKTKPRRKLF